MYSRAQFLVLGTLFVVLCAVVSAQTPNSTSSLVQATLTSPGSLPFHLKATVTQKDDPNSKTEVEMLWMSPDKWRRTIQGPEFSQTLIVNGGKVLEQDSNDYFPLYLQTLVTAMFDPQSLLDAIRPSDRLETQANRRWQKPFICGIPQQGNVAAAMGMICHEGPYKQMETVDAPGHPVQFADYKDSKGKKVARLLISIPETGVGLEAQVSKLEELKKPNEDLFAINQGTPKEKQIRTVPLPEAEFRSHATQPLDIIWPQVLDGAVTGTSSYYISVDRTGTVRETVPLETANERANDSARRQIMKWKFNPAMKDGAAVQAEGILTFTTNTRAWGPPEPLTNEEVRKLASNLVEPVFPTGVAPSGTTYSLRAAVDHEGNVIEVVAGDGPPELFQPCYEAIKKWHFNPLMENGQPRPYRAEIRFRVS